MREKVLVIDDDKDVLDLLQSFLVEYGIHPSNIITSHDAVDGLNKFTSQQNAILCVICDYYMPTANGDELCDIIKGNQPSTYIIIQTGDTDITKNKVRSVDAVIHKPFTYKKFEAVLKSCFKV